MSPLLRITTLMSLALLVAGQGKQFITGPCTSDADCAAGCCGFNTGKCAGAVIALTRDGGCGFGDAQPNSNAAQALGFSVSVQPVAATPAPAAPAAPAPAVSSAAKVPGTQFITGTCTADSDCASTCCAFKTGKCAAVIPAQERGEGCGFGEAQPNRLTAQTNGQQAAAAAAPISSPVTTQAKAPGTQFITGACTADADCASTCCAFKTGKCAAVIPAQERGEGCGFGETQPNRLNAQANGQQAAVVAAPVPSAATTLAKAPGTQFITGACTADADCASTCCAFKTGKCAAVIPAQERGEGCGFGEAQPNRLTVQANTPNAQAATPATPAPAIAAGTQFITGACTSDADCALGCCGFNTGKCAGPVVAQERDGGCGFGDAQPNDNAAQALKSQRLGKKGVIYWM